VAAPTAVTRVLLVHDYAGERGGGEVLMHSMRAALRRRGIDARLMASSADPAGPGSAADYVFRGSTGPLRALRETVNLDAVRVARHVLETFNPQVVHLGMFLTQASPAILPVFRSRPVLWAPNEYRPTCPRGNRLLPDGHPCLHPAGMACLRHQCFHVHGLAPRLLQLRLLKRWRPCIDLVVAPSVAFRHELERHGVAVDLVVPHGIPIASIPERQPAVPAFLAFAGRLVPEKGVHVLLDAMALLPSSLSHVRLRVAGDGPERAALEARARRLGLADRVEFLGHLSREAVESGFAAAAVQVVPSLWCEPFGLVAVEAMVRGTPLMVSAAGALPELVEDGRTGYVVPAGNARALASRLADVLQDDAGRAAVCREARRAACEAFDIDRVVDVLMACYAGLLNRPAPSR
jgi:glycosyltransferase involved in cell wall biosynthesis